MTVAHTLGERAAGASHALLPGPTLLAVVTGDGLGRRREHVTAAARPEHGVSLRMTGRW
ncbi:MAG: hypothetical protein OXQ31_10980 [Spirochaetaceae bacterium]|nr:hypothetical protein [Spirochaetaceae bacterium]